ncbi:MAG TPA: hypothetical protein VHB21_00210 [Minicystis sp.]|nr:hypothetical protein [Minicystis sp.]
MRAGLFAAAVLVAGCGSSFGNVELAAPTSKYAVSMNELLSDGRGIVEASRIKKLGDFAWEAPACTKGTLDVSRALNDQIEKLGGDALIGFTVEARKGDDCVAVRARGTVVKVLPRS